jgi:Protein of unknown function (DUF1761)
MHFAGLNYLAVLFAAAAGFAFGAVYYTTLGHRWMRALGKTKEDIERNKSPMPFIIAAVAQVLMAYVMAGAIGHLGEHAVTVRNGLITGLFMWVGFILTTVSVNYAFQGQKPMLTVIDAGHWLGVLLLQGLIVGWMGV